MSINALMVRCVYSLGIEILLKTNFTMDILFSIIFYRIKTKGTTRQRSIIRTHSATKT